MDATGSIKSADSEDSSEYKIEWLCVSAPLRVCSRVKRFWIEWKRVSCNEEFYMSEAVLKFIPSGVLREECDERVLISF